MRRIIKPSLVALFVLAVVSPATGGVLLYDVDFSTPPHVVGQPPTLGDGPAPRSTPSEIPMGEPLVVAALGALVDQPCAFGDHPTAMYDQLKFTTAALPYPHGFPEAYGFYHIEMDVLVEPLGTGESFKIYLDCPTAHSVQFNAAGEIRASVLGEGSYNVLIGAYVPGTPLFLEVDTDIDADSWTIYVDGFELFTGAYPSEALRTMRISLATGLAVDPVAVDNVRVVGGAEPSCPADVNGDGFVDVLDLLAVIAAWGNTSGPEDINGDGIVNVLDLLAVIAVWGPC